MFFISDFHAIFHKAIPWVSFQYGAWYLALVLLMIALMDALFSKRLKDFIIFMVIPIIGLFALYWGLNFRPFPTFTLAVTCLILTPHLHVRLRSGRYPGVTWVQSFFITWSGFIALNAIIFFYISANNIHLALSNDTFSGVIGRFVLWLIGLIAIFMIGKIFPRSSRAS